MIIDETFPHDYGLEEIHETTGFDPPRYYYPGAYTRGGHNGILLLIRPRTRLPWVGMFANGDLKGNGFHGVFTTPNQETLCVVARGSGYFVSPEDPTSWELVKVVPILDARPIHNKGIIVFADFTDLVAYGQSGIQWRTNRLALDGLKITEVTDSVIKGSSWYYRADGTDGTSTFVVDLTTGAILDAQERKT